MGTLVSGGSDCPEVQAVVPLNATLHDALEEILMSNAGQAVVVDDDDRFYGILDVATLADVLKRMRADAKKHYEDLAAQARRAGAHHGNGDGTEGSA